METLWSRSEAATRGDGGVGGSADGGAGALPLPLLAAVEARADGAAGNAPSDDAAAPEEPAVGAAPRGVGGSVAALRVAPAPGPCPCSQPSRREPTAQPAFLLTTMLRMPRRRRSRLRS